MWPKKKKKTHNKTLPNFLVDMVLKFTLKMNKTGSTVLYAQAIRTLGNIFVGEIFTLSGLQSCRSSSRREN